MLIAHISDTHITNEVAFKAYAFDLIVNEINTRPFDLVIHTGDVTNNGLREEYEHASYLLKKIEKPLIVAPGNQLSQVKDPKIHNYLWQIY